MNMILLLTSCAALIGCAGAAATSPTSKPTLDQRFTIAIDADKATWTAYVNTGGWKLTTDRVETDGKTLRVFATLERPGDDEMVAAAFQTLKGEAVANGATTAEFSVRQTQRGAKSKPAYTVVAKTNGK